MITINKLANTKMLAILITVFFALNSVYTGSASQHIDYNEDVNRDVFDDFDWANGIPDNNQLNIEDLDGDSVYDSDVGEFLSDNENIYNQVWDPWVSKAAIHAVATTPDGDKLALAGGYLYDNQVHLYQWNYQTNMYDLVWEIGGGIFLSDVTSLAFADTDYNNLTEIIAGGEDGVLYVFEQRHIYDPVTNMENMYDLVWKSPRLGRIFDVMVYDTDGDFRQDIIVGTGDTVRWYEYSEHGNYPFSQDHWIEFKEVFSYKLPSFVTALGVSDVNSNGLKEVAAGTRSGKLYLLENNGTTLKINGFDYPIIQDNSYRYLWDSENIIRRPVSDIVGGDLDQDGQNELMIAVQGQGAYVLDTIDGVYGVYRLQREFAKWETNPVEIYPLDVYTDAMINSSSWFNNTDLTKLQSNVFYQNTTNFWPEPLNYTLYGNFIIYPYSSYSVMNQRDQPDGAWNGENRYTTFWGDKPTAFWDTAWAVYDWGNDEEAAGNGISSLPDMKVYVKDTSIAVDQINISISADNVNFYKVNSSYVKNDSSGKFYTVEVDPTMGAADINFYKYFKFEVLSGTLLVDVFETMSWNNPIYDALSVETGFMTFKNEETPTPVGFIGTIDGAVLAVRWDATAKQYKIVWDSWANERWKMKTNIFDLETVKHTGRFPGWIDKGTFSDVLDLGTAPDGGKVVSWTAENFYDFDSGNTLEYVVISDLGGLFVYEQADPNFPPTYNPQLSQMLFGSSLTTTGYGVQDWVTALSGAGYDYITASILPIDFFFKSEDVYGHQFDPFNNGWMLYLGAWGGTLGNLDQGNPGTPVKGEIDVSLWYLVTDKTVDTTQNPGTCEAYSMAECSYFNPLLQEGAFQDFYNSISGLVAPLASLSSTELTGQMWGTFASSTWMPKVAAGDFIGENNLNDYIVTNGKISLLEASFGLGQTQSNADFTLKTKLEAAQWVQLSSDPIYSEFNFVARGGYFDEINENSKGRHWSNANPVDFDGDGDMDLILGFATYSMAEFGFDKVTFGATYWENEGTREEPIWVEKPLAMTNTDPESGFRANNYTDPLLVFDEYDMGKVLSTTAGFHHSLRTERPTRILMWQPVDHANIFSGRIRAFHATYDHPTSLLAATYPTVKRIDINLQYVDNGGLDTDLNFGFHIFETWDNSEELNDWTLSLSTADLDQDGKNEIIVGDFNNNIYVFEHLSNNTYKRAFKSFDINRTITTNESPYSHDLFDGISGDFQRTLFDHVKYLNAGFDLNNNSLQEFVATTDNMIFIFEARTSPTGRVMDDTYELIRIIDLLDFPTLMDQDPEQTVITAVTWADDMTRDGRRELIIAATSALLVLEVFQAPTPGYQQAGEFRVEEIFFGDSYNLKGLYDFPGNFFVHDELIIEALLVEDLDDDGRIDLALGGTDTSHARPLWGGFITILEWRGGGFRTLGPDGSFDETVKYNPVHDFAVDDADFDGQKELLVAHNYGVDIYEFTADDTVALVEVITSSPHYQLPDRNYFASVVPLNDHKDVVRDPVTQELVMVYSDVLGGLSRLLITRSSDEGKTWAAGLVISTTPATPADDMVSSNRRPGGTYVYLGQEEPSLVYDNNGILWMSFVERYRRTATNIMYYDVFLVKNPVSGSGNNAYYVYYDAAATGDQENSPTPRVFNIYDNFNTNKIGIALSLNLLAKSMVFFKVDIAIARAFTPYIYEAFDFPEYANTSQIPSNFAIQSLDIVQLDGNSNRYGLTFAGYPLGESLSMDLDLFYDEIKINSSSTADWSFNVTRPNRLYASGMTAQNPSIIQEQHTGNLLITYEEQTLRPYGGLFGIWSNDKGVNWNGPHDMSHLLGLDIPLLIEALPTRTRESYVISATIGFEAITEFESRIPVIVAGINRGFTMVYTVHVEFMLGTSTERKGSRVGLCAQDPDQSKLYAHTTNVPGGCDRGLDLNFIVSAINPWSNFTWYNLGAANSIAVGDTDRDSRHEILVASGKQAYLYEFSQNAVGYIKHEEKWISDPYERDITGIAISDANGNGFPEIVLESERGIVQTFEVVNTLQKVSDLIYTKEEKQLTKTSTLGQDNSVVAIVASDLNGDGIEDFVYTTLDGYLIAIDGSDYSTLWQKTTPGSSVLQYLHTRDREISLAVSSDTATGNAVGVILAVGTELYWYNPATGDNTFTYSFAITGDENVKVLRTGDVTGGTSEEIAVGLSNGTVFLMRSNDLAIIWNYDFGLGLGLTENNDPTDIQFAQFTNDNVTQVAVLNNQGDVIVLRGSNKAVEWQASNPADSKNSGLALVDVDGDGKSDLLYGKNSTFAVSGLDGSQLWNSTTSMYDTRGQVAILRDGDTASATLIQSDLSIVNINADIIDVSTTLTYEQLLPYGLVFLVSDDGTMGDKVAVGNILAEYIDKGGKLVNFAYTYVDIWGIRGALYSGGYLPLKAGNNDNTPKSYDGLSTHIVLDSVSTLNTVSMNADLSLGAEVLARHSDGSPMIALLDNVMTVDTNIASLSGDRQKLFQNIATYMLNRNDVTVQETIVYDVNGDLVDDVIYSMYHSEDSVALYALSGVNGAILWTYTPATPFDGRSSGMMKLFTLVDGRDVLAVQNAASTQNSPGLTILIDPSTGVARGGIDIPHGGVALDVSNLNTAGPMIIIGGGDGNVYIHSLWGGQPVVPAVIIPELTAEPFFALGDEFSRRTEYLMADIIQSPLLPVDGSDNIGDGIDDIIVLDHFYVAMADTYSLLEDPAFNEVEWAIDDPSIGFYLGGADLLDTTGDGIPDLIVAPFTTYLYGININDGSILWKVDYWINDDFNMVRDFRMEFVDLDNNPTNGLEIVYTRLLKYLGIPVSEIVTLANDGTQLKNIYVPFSQNFVFKAGDVDADGNADIIFSVNYFYNPLISLFGIFDQNLVIKSGTFFPLVGMPPITEIAVADFDYDATNVGGDEFILFFEMAELNLPEIIYSLIGFPTLFVQFAWDKGASQLKLPNDNILGFSPTREPTVDYWIDDRDSFIYMIVKSRTGDLFNYQFDNNGLIMQENGIIKDAAIPYAKTSFAITNLCGGEGFISLTAANSLACYDTMNFTTAVEITTLTLEFSVIQDMIVADLDNDAVDDLMVASFSGHVWVIRSLPPNPLLLELNAPIESVEQFNTPIRNDLTTTTILQIFAVTSSYIGISVVILKRTKFKFKSIPRSL